MTLQSAIEAELPFLRAEAEAGMQDTFTVSSITRQKVDGLDQDIETSQGTTRGKIAGPSSQARDTNTRTAAVGGVERPVIEGGLHIPIASPAPEIGWHCTLTVLGPMTDPSLLNSVWRVVDVPAKSYATARRLESKCSM